jgi:hypothetical protein
MRDRLTLVPLCPFARDSLKRHPRSGQPGGHERQNSLICTLAEPSQLDRTAVHIGGYFAQVRRARLLSVIVLLSGHVLSWQGSRAAAGSG